MKTQNTNESETPAAVAGAAPCSAVWNGQLYAHPLHQAIYDVCQAIEKIPIACPEETQAVIMAATLGQMPQARAVGSDIGVHCGRGGGEGGRAMKREHLLAAVRVAGYHNDTALGTRLYIGNRMSRAAYNEAFLEGVRQRKAGVKCNCSACKEGVCVPV